MKTYTLYFGSSHNTRKYVIKDCTKFSDAVIKMEQYSAEDFSNLVKVECEVSNVDLTINNIQTALYGKFHLPGNEHLRATLIAAERCGYIKFVGNALAEWTTDGFERASQELKKL